MDDRGRKRESEGENEPMEGGQRDACANSTHDWGP